MVSRLPVAVSLLVLIWSVPSAEGQGPPDEIPQLHWISVVEALAQEVPEGLYPEARRLVNEQSEKFRATFGSAAEHGLQEGRLPP